MGQKIHPYGYRVGITQPHSARWFANTYQYPQYVFEDFLLRQSLIKVLPVENLPRQRAEDTSETKLVRVKIERFIRNTIKIKLYVTSPQSVSSLFEVDSAQKNRKELLNARSDNRATVSKGDSKKDSLPQDRNLLLVNILKKSLNKKTTKLHILKLQNIVYKMELLKNIIETNESFVSPESASISKSDTKIALKFNTDETAKGIDSSTINYNLSYYSNFKNLIYGIKFCVNKLESNSSKSELRLNSIKRIKLKFQLLLLKKQLCISLVNQYQIYNEFEKRKLLTIETDQNQTQEFEFKTDSRFLKLSQFSFYWKNRVLQITKICNAIYIKLKLKLENLQSQLEANQENIMSKLPILVDIVKLQYILTNTKFKKENSNSFLLITLTQILTKIKYKLFSTNKKNSFEKKELELVTNLTSELNNLFIVKHKILKIVVNFNFSDEVLKSQLVKTKSYILAFCFVKSKLIKLTSKLTNLDFKHLDFVISNSILSLNLLEQRVKKNQSMLKNLLFIKIKRIQKCAADIEENILQTKTLAILENVDGINDIIKMSQLYRKFIELNKPSFDLFFRTNGLTQYYNILRNKTMNTYQIQCRKVILVTIKNENLISNKSNLLAILKDYPLHKYSKTKGFYKFCKVLLNQRRKIKQILEFKIKSLLVKISEKLKNTQSLEHTIRSYNENLNLNNLYIKQLENWLTLLKTFISRNSFSTQELSVVLNAQSSVSTSVLLRSRITKIDRYLYKLIPLKTNNSLGKIERTLIYVNFNILKQKLLYELLQIQRSSLFSSTTNSFIIKNKDILSKANWTILNKILPIVKNRIIQLQTFLSTISPDSDIDIKQPLISPSIPLQTNLQKLLKTNYEKSFVVLQTRRKVFNNFIHRLGGRQKSQHNLNTQNEWSNLMEQSLTGNSDYFNFSNDKNRLNNNSIDSIQQKILSRKPVKTLSTRKQKFLVKKTLKKKMKKFLIEMALKNNYNHIFALKNIYNVKTLSKLCENLTNIQTLPKVSVIEFVKISQPKQYAVCLANFIVENLEKRFSFRSTMKKAAEQAMSTPNVKGIKIQVSGRLNGAEIARTEWLRDGRVPLQTLRANIDYSYKTAKTIYGVLGVKVWIFKNTTANFNE
uniref:Small ribosomal subunit protein uS3c n=1 Tax=Aphanochaete confervicola TaxID=764104 RepID=A0A6H1XE52_9CHLO|nr:ribosomal protein S3 [Aphanochaete confervicola]QJA13889.1 ribosomal protein S3 [Aphanochaete confervicola]